jgi:hypothetical protein
LNTSLRNNRAPLVACAAALLLVTGIALAFYWVPNAPVEGFRQRIFYLHVPVALTAYACFIVLFLVLFLFYSAYFMLRFSVEPGPRRANLSAVYALFGVVLIPVSFLAIRLAENLIHPVVFSRDLDENLTLSQFLTFLVCLAGTLGLAASLYLNELTGKRVDERLRELREALS